MNMFTRLPKILLRTALPVLFFSSILISCATQQPVRQTESQKQVGSKPILIEHPERFFWEIKGNSGSVYILGTIHVADRSFYPLEKNVLKAFDSADRLVSEIGGQQDMEALVGELQAFILKNINTDPQKNLLQLLSEDELSVLYDAIGEDSVHQLALCNPWLLNTVAAQVLLSKAGMNAQDGIDIYLMDRAKDRKIFALETAEQQLAVLSYGSFEDQLASLKDTITSLQHIDESAKEINTLRKLYLSNDRQGLTALLVDMLLEVPASFSDKKVQQYIDVLLTSRNRIWAQKLADYLQAGGTTFVFAGSAHFIGDSNVFAIMRQQGLLQ